MLAEGFLHRMQLPALGQTLDRDDLRALTAQREGGTRFHRRSVDMHDTGAALARVATHMRAGQPQLVTKKLHQQSAAIDLRRNGLAVHGHGKFGHRSSELLAVPLRAADHAF